MAFRPYLILQCLVFLVCTAAGIAHAGNLPPQSAVFAAMRLVDDHWISDHADPGSVGWSRAAYFTGHMALYARYPKTSYLDYAVLWGEQYDWGLVGGPYTRNADNQCCGQTYLDLYDLNPNPQYLADITTSINAMVNSPQCDDWWWIDALFMAMPVFTRLGVLYDDTDYHDKMYGLYADTKYGRGLYNADWGLWHRDEDYLLPATTPNGQPIFWSRGNGWVLAGHARVLDYLPLDDPHRDEYIEIFQTMCAALKEVQRPDGFWNVSLADSLDFTGPETSGTAFFCYGMAWGILNGFLDEATYLPVVSRAWNGLTNIAVHPDGVLGYVQNVGHEPGSSQPVTYDSTANFGVGSFLLAGSLVSRLADASPVPAPGDNLAFGGSILHSDALPGYPADHAVDDNYATWWQAEGYPQWIEIDLGEVRSATLIELVPHDRRAYQYLVETKMAVGDDYQVLVDRSASTEADWVLSDHFPPTQGRFFKLTVTGAHDYLGAETAIHELRIVAPPISTVESDLIPDLHSQPLLDQNVPNPFNPITTINFRLPLAGQARLTVHDLAGRRLTVLHDGLLPAGHYARVWNGRDELGRKSPSGVYLYRLLFGDRVETKRMLLLR